MIEPAEFEGFVTRMKEVATDEELALLLLSELSVEFFRNRLYELFPRHANVIRSMNSDELRDLQKHARPS